VPPNFSCIAWLWQTGSVYSHLFWKEDIDCLLSLNAIDDFFFGSNTVSLHQFWIFWQML
jgi:hypothetical protein